MKTSTSSGESSGVLAGASPQKTHGETPGARDQSRSNLRDREVKMLNATITSKGYQDETQQKYEGPQSLDDQGNHHLTLNKANHMINIIILEGLTSQKSLDDHHLIVLEGLTSQKSLDDHHLKEGFNGQDYRRNHHLKISIIKLGGLSQ
jgi:hypothetical protein